MTKSKKSCQYCGGRGYVQILLGGTETCAGCSGSGQGKK